MREDFFCPWHAVNDNPVKLMARLLVTQRKKASLIFRSLSNIANYMLKFLSWNARQKWRRDKAALNKMWKAEHNTNQVS